MSWGDDTKLTKPGIGTTGWGTAVNQNFQDIMEAFSGREDVESLKMIDNGWIGISGTEGRIEFGDEATDELRFKSCNVLVDENVLLATGKWVGIGATYARMQMWTGSPGFVIDRPGECHLTVRSADDKAPFLNLKGIRLVAE